MDVCSGDGFSLSSSSLDICLSSGKMCRTADPLVLTSLCRMAHIEMCLCMAPAVRAVAG